MKYINGDKFVDKTIKYIFPWDLSLCTRVRILLQYPICVTSANGMGNSLTARNLLEIYCLRDEAKFEMSSKYYML